MPARSSRVSSEKQYVKCCRKQNRLWKQNSQKMADPGGKWLNETDLGRYSSPVWLRRQWLEGMRSEGVSTYCSYTNIQDPGSSFAWLELEICIVSAKHSGYLKAFSSTLRFSVLWGAEQDLPAVLNAAHLAFIYPFHTWMPASEAQTKLMSRGMSLILSLVQQISFLNADNRPCQDVELLCLKFPLCPFPFHSPILISLFFFPIFTMQDLSDYPLSFLLMSRSVSLVFLQMPSWPLCLWSLPWSPSWQSDRCWAGECVCC